MDDEFDMAKLLEDDAGKDWEKLVSVAQFHDAGHAYLASNIERLRLLEHQGFATDPEVAPEAFEGGKGYSPTPLGHLLNALACSMTRAFTIIVTSGKPLSSEDVRQLMLRASLVGARLGLAFGKDDMRDWQEAFVTVPEEFKRWALAPDEEDNDGQA